MATTTPVNVPLTLANKAYSSGTLTTKTGSMQCRTSYDVIIGDTELSVNGASPPGPYITMKAGTPFLYDLSIGKDSFWFASAQAGVVVEIQPEQDRQLI
jgi:hypothetical protein